MDRWPLLPAGRAAAGPRLDAHAPRHAHLPRGELRQLAAASAAAPLPLAPSWVAGWLRTLRLPRRICPRHANSLAPTQHRCHPPAPTHPRPQPTNCPPQVHEWLAEYLPAGASVGIDPAVHTIEAAEKLKRRLAAAGKRLVALPSNPVDAIWEGRPAAPDVSPRLPQPPLPPCPLVFRPISFQKLLHCAVLLDGRCLVVHLMMTAIPPRMLCLLCRRRCGCTPWSGRGRPWLPRWPPCGSSWQRRAPAPCWSPCLVSVKSADRHHMLF